MHNASLNRVTFKRKALRYQTSVFILGMALLANGAPASAQTTTTALPPSVLTTPSTDTTTDLIQLLVEQKLITKKAATVLLRKAQARAAQALATQTESAKATESAKVLAQAPPASSPELDPNAVHVPYVPQIVQDQIRDNVKKELLATVKTEGWAQPGALPEWINRISWNGDFRFRTDFTYFSAKNNPVIFDFETFNTSGPTDINPQTNRPGLPTLNTTQNRGPRERIRARFGFTADVVANYATVGVRLATGDDTSPISTNSVLGGGLGKKNIYLDQAYLMLKPVPWAAATFGRMPNPFSISDLFVDDDVNFDGVTAELASPKLLGRDLTIGLVGGAYPLSFGSGNFPSRGDAKQNVPSKWLFAAQGKGTWNFATRYSAQLAAGFFRFQDVQGQLSSACDVVITPQCDSDFTQPQFLKKGNTLFFIRNIVADIPGQQNFAQPQLAGLSYKFDVLDVNAKLAAIVTDNISVSLFGEYVRNLAFDKLAGACSYPGLNAIGIGVPITNITSVLDSQGNFVSGNPCSTTTIKIAGVDKVFPAARVDSGNKGWTVKLGFGYTKPKKFGEWNFEASYRYLQSDAVLDALTDSDFHQGGTNNKGYTLQGTLGIYNNVTLSGKWLSANQISGDPLAIDVFQLDLKASF